MTSREPDCGEPIRRPRAAAPCVPYPLVLAPVVLLSLVVGGCATYSKSVRKAKDEVAASDPEAGVQYLNKAIGVNEYYELPKKLEGKQTLLLLERATVLQALGKYEVAARDMMIADQRLDWLDIAAAGKAKIGKYIYSGTSVRYRAPPYERLLLNTLNMVNFLALRDWEGATVEARRFTILEHFFLDKEDRTLLPGVVAFGNYLGAVAFEASGDYREAARRYVKAWAHGIRYDRLRERLARICAMTGYEPSELVDIDSEAVDELDRAVAGTEPPSFDAYRERYVDGELIVLVQTGLVPYKEPERYPLVQALDLAGPGAYAGGAAAAYALSESDRSRARELAVSGALKWVNFPKLSEDGLPPNREVSLLVDGESHEVGLGVDVEKQVEHAWDRLQGPLMAAAISRMLVRAAAGGIAREASKHAASKSDDRDVRRSSSGLGMLSQAVVEGGMAIADRPDTRSWSFLPARIRFRRLHLPAGEREVVVRVAGREETQTAEVRESGPTLINFSKYR